MAHATWTYLADDGKNHRIGLFHGPRTGHVLIHINSKITTIDFGVRKSKTYSLFINEELIEISIVKSPTEYTYNFKINDKVDTPANRAKKITARKNLFFSVLLVTTIVGLSVVIAVVSGKHRKERELRKKERLERALKDFGKDGKITKEEKQEILRILNNN